MILKVDNYIITPGRFIAGTRGSYGIEKLDFEFSAEWEGLAVTVCFYPPSGEPVAVIYNGEPIDIPNEVMSCGGTSRFVVSGCHNEQSLITAEGLIRVLNTSVPTDNPALEPTPGAFDQLMTAVESKASSDHNHDLRYAPRDGLCTGLTSGYAENLVSPYVFAYEGVISGHPVADGDDSWAIFAGRVGYIEGVSVRQLVRYGNFIGTEGWQAKRGSLAANEYTGVFTLEENEVRDGVGADFELTEGTTLIMTDYSVSEYTMTTDDTDIIGLSYEDEFGHWQISASAPGYARITCECLSGDTAYPITDILIRVRHADGDDNLTMISHPLDISSGDKYYIRADIKCPTAQPGIVLSLFDGTDHELQASPTAEWQTVSGIVTASADAAGSIRVMDKRQISAAVTSMSEHVVNASVDLLNRFMKGVGAFGAGADVSYVFSCSGGQWQWVRLSGSINITLSDFGMSCSVDFDPEVDNYSASFTVRLSYPFDMGASAAVTTAGETGLGSITVNADRFAGALGIEAASGSYVFSYLNGDWQLNGSGVSLADYGITGSGSGIPAAGATVTVALTLIPESIRVRRVQACNVSSPALDNFDKAALDALFGSVYHNKGMISTRVGAVSCTDTDNDYPDEGLLLSRDYELRRLPSGAADRLDIANGKLYTKTAVQVIGGEVGDYVTLDGAKPGTDYLCNAGDIGTVTGTRLRLSRRIINERVCYERAEPLVKNISESDMYRAAGGGKEKLFIHDALHGGYSPAYFGAVGGLSYVPDVCRQTDKNRVYILGLLDALGIIDSSEAAVGAASAEISAALGRLISGT